MQAPPPTTPPKGSASFSIDTIAVDPHQPPEPYPSFPNNLPPRAKHDPAARPSFFRFLWYIRPGAYSLRKLSADTRHGMVARIRWRRICMIWIVLMRVGISAEISLAAYWEQWLLITYIVFSVVGFWSILACLTNIGDAEGTRRELGMDIVSFPFTSIGRECCSDIVLTDARSAGEEVAGCFSLRHGCSEHHHLRSLDHHGLL